MTLEYTDIQHNNMHSESYIVIPELYVCKNVLVHASTASKSNTDFIYSNGVHSYTYMCSISSNEATIMICSAVHNNNNIIIIHVTPILLSYL